jgi:hypothetical protein
MRTQIWWMTRWILEKYAVRMGNGLQLCPVAGFGISGAEPLHSVTSVLS